MESNLKRGIEIRKSIRLPSTKRMAPAPPPPLPPRLSTDDSSATEPPPTSLRQLLGNNDNHNTDNDDSPSARVPHPLSVVEVEVKATASSGGDKRQLAVRTVGGGIAAAAAATKLAVDDGVRELNLKNLRIAATEVSPDNNKVSHNNSKMIDSGAQQSSQPPPPPQKATPPALLTARKMAPLSPSLVRRITTLNQKVGQPRASNVTVSGTSSVVTAAAGAHPIKLSDLDGLVKRRDYVNQEAVAGVAPLRMPIPEKRSAIPEDVPPLTSIDVLNQIQQQISNMEVSHHEHQHFQEDASIEDVSRYKERIKMSKRYGEKDELSMKHGTSDVASNQLLGYLGDYRDNVRPSTETDDEIDRASEDENAHHGGFQRGSSVRKSTGGAVMASKVAGTTHGKGKPVSRTASDTKNLETKIKMMREATSTHHHGPNEAAAMAARRAKPVVSNKLPFSFKPRILDMNEKHLIHQVTPPSTTTTGAAPGINASPSASQQYHSRPDEYPAKASPSPAAVRPMHTRVQSVHSHAKKTEQVIFGIDPCASCLALSEPSRRCF